MTPFEAAQVLVRHNHYQEAETILKNLWLQHDNAEEFSVFCALLETGIKSNLTASRALLDDIISGEGEWTSFWNRRSLIEQAIMFEWQGELAFHMKDDVTALDSLTRAASLGRDTTTLWLLLGILYLKNRELDLSVRYLKRSLELFKQPGLEILDPKEGFLGAFLGTHPLEFNPGAPEYLATLLEVVKLAQNRRSLKSVRDLVVEMIHQFPREERLPKIRLLIEKSLVTQSLRQSYNLKTP
jgi:tetratricopeptide (TPR) repeat protein